MHGKMSAVGTRQAGGGTFFETGASASICFDTCQLGHPVTHLEFLPQHHASSPKESPHHKVEAIMRRRNCRSQEWIMHIYFADTLNEGGRISCSGGRPPPEVRFN